MATGKTRVVGPGDIERTVRSVADIFDADVVVIVGSQALLVGRDDIRRDLRMSEEVDAYPGNLREWEAENPGMEASEVINALLGEGSDFHKTHGFFVDGVDDKTASLPPDWKERAVRRTVHSLDGRTVEAIAPEPNDLVAAKLVRGDPKDIAFARICMQSGLVKHDKVKQRLEILMPAETLSIALGRLQAARHPQIRRGSGRGDGNGW